MKFDVLLFFENLWRKYKFSYNTTRLTDTLHEDQCKVMIISLSVLFRMRKFSEEIPEQIKTYFIFNKSPPPKKKSYRL